LNGRHGRGQTHRPAVAAPAAGRSRAGGAAPSRKGGVGDAHRIWHGSAGAAQRAAQHVHRVGCFSLLALADSGGLRRPRAIAYASATVGGAGLVVIGTLASTSPWIAALVTLFVAFAIRFAGLFGGYALTAQVALLPSFVLSVAVPAPPAALGPAHPLRPSIQCAWDGSHTVEALIGTLAGFRLVGRLEDPVAEAARAVRVPWWR
jgi:hypothetical protein